MTGSQRNNILAAASLLHNARSVTVLTGAGVSKESGVPTFRDALEGLWARFSPEQLATSEAFQRNPKLVWDWYQFRRELVQRATPNPGHVAIASLEKRLPRLITVTQNVDDLHERAGSQYVYHLHGRIANNRCFFDCQGDGTYIDVSRMTWNREFGPPPCPYCGRWVRPDVVWFGESLPVDALEKAMESSISSEVMLVIGTSGLVSPASMLPSLARDHGAVVIEVNPDDTPLTALATIKLSGPSGVLLPSLLQALESHAH